MADVFRKLLPEIASSSGSVRVELEWLVSGKFLSYEEIAQFHAAVFFPEQPDKLTFLWQKAGLGASQQQKMEMFHCNFC